jgi:hypothetical protein
MWFSSYQALEPLEFKNLYNSRANSDQGDDFQVLLRLAHTYCLWNTGTKKEVLGGQPLKSKMVLELQGLSAHDWEAYFANLMS